MAQQIKFGWLRDFNGAKFVPKILAQCILNNDGTKYVDTVNNLFNNRTQVRICTWENEDTGNTSTGTDHNNPYDDIVLEGNEYLLVTISDKLLVNNKDEYLTAEKGE